MKSLPKDREHYVLDNLNLVHNVLHNQLHIYKNHSNYNDYFQEGCIGLILAAIRFDDSKEIQFSTFAFHYIYGMIRTYKRNTDYLIYYPEKIKNVIPHIIQYLHQGYDPDKIAEKTNIPLKDIQDAINMNTLCSLDYPILINETKSIFVADTIPDLNDPYENSINAYHIMDTIQEVTNSITNDKWKTIWEEYIYGLIHGEKITQKYLAKKHGFSRKSIAGNLKKFRMLFIEKLNS